jgi:Flp pilus assembly protein TadD
VNDIELNALGAQGMAALARGGNAEALRCFNAIVEAGRADGTVWVALALARQAFGDPDGTAHALDAALKLEPQNVRALLMKGDLMAAAGDRRAAVSFMARRWIWSPIPRVCRPRRFPRWTGYVARATG